jgi:hypothetical protein
MAVSFFPVSVLAGRNPWTFINNITMQAGDYQYRLNHLKRNSINLYSSADLTMGAG